MNLNMFDEMSGARLRETMEVRMAVPDDRMSVGMTAFPANTPLGMAYVPFQRWGEVYPEDEAFSRGTMFPQLDFPFEGGCCDE